MKTTDFLLTNVTVQVRVPAVAFPFVKSENDPVTYNHLWTPEHLSLKYMNIVAITNYHNCILLSFINYVYLTNLFLLFKQTKYTLLVPIFSVFCSLHTIPAALRLLQLLPLNAPNVQHKCSKPRPPRAAALLEACDSQPTETYTCTAPAP